MRIGAQAVGAMVAITVAERAVLFHTANETAPLGTNHVAEAVVAFGFMLIALGVAQRRNATVPSAIGAFAMASFWMTGRATVGNPLIAVALLTARGTPGEAFCAIGAEVLGAALAVLLARFLFPEVRAAATHLLFVPRKADD